jgi:predicted DNA-binding protein
MRLPIKERTSFRLAPEVRQRLADLASVAGQSQTAVLESLINDAANGSDDYFVRAAAISAWTSMRIVAALAANLLEPSQMQEIGQMLRIADTLFGAKPTPPLALRRQARRLVEQGEVDAGDIVMLKAFGFVDP